MGEMNDKDFGLSPSTRSERREGDVLYVVVLYRQKLSECNAYRTLLHDRADVYIHDNSPEAVSPEHLPEGWVYVSDPSNPGLSAAYNAAARYGIEHGFKWLMITDQDTTYQEGAGDRYEALPEQHPEEKIFIPKVKIEGGMYISPVPKRNYMTHPERQPLTGRIDLARSAIINSGLLINLEAFEKSGGYNEKVFLDFSDFQFIDRLSHVCQKGRVTTEEIRQSFSAKTDTKETQIERFRLFCKSLQGYEKTRLLTRWGIGVVALKRCLSLSLSLRSLDPGKIFIKYYV
ncbi:MAG: hypothetical protein K2G23_04180 [Muribaculaceae bacterium]|nr:hypothetical protein [Muribaculaceae bacterium]